MPDDMIQRFLRYSCERMRPIRMMWTDDSGKILAANVQILKWNQETVVFRTLRPNRQNQIDANAILSASYRKGDEGQEE